MVKNENVERLARDVADVVGHGTEKHVTEQVAILLREALRSGMDLDPSYTRPHPDRYVMYPLHVDEHERFSIASAVWNVGQSTPVHGHETWGVVGIYTGQEHETRYQKPPSENVPLQPLGDDVWAPGDVTICCTTDDDIHSVSCAGDAPCVGIHIYGADIGTLPRRAYEPSSGFVSWFTSHWATPQL